MSYKATEMDAEALVNDALHWRRRSSGAPGTCFVNNPAGSDLIRSNARVLPEIERVVDDLVEPQFARGGAPGDVFLGLSYVLCAYTFIGMRDAPIRVTNFLQSRSRGLLKEVIRCVPIGYQWTKDGYNFGAPPSPELRKFIEDLLNDSDDDLRSVALWTLQKLDQSEERRRRQGAAKGDRASG